MKLAMITPDGYAQCLLCRWVFKVQSRWHKTKKELTLDEKFKVLEEQVLYHLRNAPHNRLLLTKEEHQATEEGLLGKTYYLGRKPMRGKDGLYS